MKKEDVKVVLDSRGKPENDSAVNNGRSMVEMLGVLAVIGVLSVGGLVAYSKAVFKHRINQTVNEISNIVINTQTLFRTQTDYAGLSTSFLEGMNGFPETVRFVDHKPMHAFGGEYEIGSDSDNNNETFTLKIKGLPEKAVYALSAYDWSDLDSGRSTIFKISHRFMNAVKGLTSDKQKKDAKKSFDYASLFIPYAYAVVDSVYDGPGTAGTYLPGQSTSAPSTSGNSQPPFTGTPRPATGTPRPDNTIKYLYNGWYDYNINGNWGTFFGPVLPTDDYNWHTFAIGSTANMWYDAYFNQLNGFNGNSTGAVVLGNPNGEGLVVTYNNGLVTSIGTGLVANNGGVYYKGFYYVVGGTTSPWQNLYGSYSNDLYNDYLDANGLEAGSYVAPIRPGTPRPGTSPTSGTPRPGTGPASGATNVDTPSFVGTYLIDGKIEKVYNYPGSCSGQGTCLQTEDGSELVYGQVGTKMGAVDPLGYCRNNPSGLGCYGSWSNNANCRGIGAGTSEACKLVGTGYVNDPDYCQSQYGDIVSSGGTAGYPCVYSPMPSNDFCAQHGFGSYNNCTIPNGRAIPVWGYRYKNEKVQCSFDSFPIEIGNVVACVQSKEEENGGLFTLSITVQ